MATVTLKRRTLIRSNYQIFRRMITMQYLMLLDMEPHGILQKILTP